MLSLIFLMAGFLFLLGCGSSGPPNLKLTGQVTVNGSPAQNVDVILYSKEGPSYSGKTGDDGSFTISGVSPGEMVVTISSGATTGYDMSAASGPPPEGQGAGSKYGQQKEGGGGSGGSKMDNRTKEKLSEHKSQSAGKGPTTTTSTKIPAKYGDKTKSGLTWNVTPDNLVQKFDLTDK
jgi:hypothetical protein